MKQPTARNRRLAASLIVTLVVVGSLVIPLALMNLTPGHLGFPDNDGCACFVAYTTSPSLPACEHTRPAHCEALWSQQLVAYFSCLDFSK